MKEVKIIAIHKPTQKQYEIGTAKTVADALYDIDNYVEFENSENINEWAFQVVDDENVVGAYIDTIYQANAKYQEMVVR